MAEFDATDLDIIAQGTQLYGVSAQAADVEAVGFDANKPAFSNDDYTEVASLRSALTDQAADANLTLDATQSYNA